MRTDTSQGLNRIAADTAPTELSANCVGSSGECRFRVFTKRERALVDNVAPLVPLNEWRIRLQRFLWVCHYWQRLILDRNLLEGIFRAVAILCRYRSHRLAHIANLLYC